MTLETWICLTCGVEYDPSPEPPPACPICQDERQYVRPSGQAWTSPSNLRATHHNVFHQEEERLWSLRTEPAFAIGQRAWLLQTPEGNLLWDCLSLLDDDTLSQLASLGGVRAIAISHPHYYSSMASWSAALGNVPVHIHQDDRQWVMRPHNAHFWTGGHLHLFGGLSLIRCGGHFDGYQVAHWPAGAAGKGVLLAGDQPQVCLDTRWVTFMYSYPNWIPLSPSAVRRITAALAPLPFDRLYGAFGRNLYSDAKEIIARSEARYLLAIKEIADHR